MSADPNCVFCKIAAGEIPVRVVYQDQAILAFLDIAPLAEGHLLVIPLAHYPNLSEMPPEAAAALAAHLPRLGGVLRDVTQAAGFNLLANEGAVAGQEINHVHFHLIPRKADDGLGYRWKPGEYAEGRADELLNSLRQALADREA
jgi:histidine triad (HIT) family protein